MLRRSLATAVVCCLACGGHAPSGGDSDGAVALWWRTCSAPACPAADAGVPDSGLQSCSSQLVGSACSSVGEQCDPHEGCSVYLRCSTSDPRNQYGGCPVSRMRFKKDIHYLAPEELRGFARDLLALPLADFRYRSGDHRKRLGFMIDGHESLACVDGDHVDLYAYTTMAVATLQVQAAEITELREELAAMRTELAKRRP
jgi:hypothetical protein